ncbi:hypothetical protein COU36_02695, partial [Candidatus Micrarchaeota archaeon CG10_big_fil_rev_8_21_14_0_10_59_7]
MRKLALLLVVLVAALACAKSYSIPDASLSYAVQPDGSVLVSEKISFDFRGSYTFAYRDFDFSKGGRVENLVVYEGAAPYSPSCNKQPSTFCYEGSRVTWYYRANDEARAFEIRYALKGAVKAYDDVAELYWKVWGSLGVGVGIMNVDVSLPKPLSNSSELRVWGHPSLDGSIERRSGGALLSVRNVPSEQWVEARIVFPRNVLSSTAGAKVMMGGGLQMILDEEANWAEENEVPWQLWFYGAVAALFLGPILLLGIGAYCYLKWGKEPAVRYQGEYERDIPYDYPPAIAGGLVGFGADKNDFTATVLDLVRRKYLGLKKVKKEKFLGVFGKSEDYEFAVLKRDERGLLDHEKMVLHAFEDAGDGKKTTLDDLTKHLRYKKDFFGIWQHTVKDEIEKRKLVDMTGLDRFRIFGIAPVAISFIISFVDPLAFIVAFPTVMLYVLLAVGWKAVMANRTQEGAEQNARWLAFKRFVGDFTLLKEKPPESVVMWERYLVYATALGEGKTVEKAMAVDLSDAQRRRSPLLVYYYPGMGGALGSSLSGALTAATAAGYGGGFGGGGG